MNTQNKFAEKRTFKMSYEGKYFLYGIIFGGLFTILVDYVLNHNSIMDGYNRTQKVEELRVDIEERLLNYIDGKWSSSIGDIIISIDIDQNKEFIVIENSTTQVKRIFKIHDITKISGLLGIVKMNIIEIGKEEKEENLIPIQFNKIFGLPNTIAISYDSRLTYCIESSDSCTRAFKRIQ